jgi:hypothetical protein
VIERRFWTSDVHHRNITHMRTTLDLDSSVLAQLKEQQRLQKNKTLGQLASELLAKALAQASAAPATEPLAWTVQPMQARLDLEDRDTVQRVLDEDR